MLNRAGVVLFGLAIALTPLVAFASEPGTIGIAVNQLYSEQQPTKRGAFMVRRVDPSSAGADAGIQTGDLILAVDGKRVFNREADEVIKSMAGPAGSSVELSIVPANGNLEKILLVRKPYPPNKNPQTDTFRYVVPGDWQFEPRYNFPLPWSPGLSLKGYEDLYFAPGFDDLNSPEYHSYLFLWWLEGKQEMTATELEAYMVVYFKGLAQQRGHNNHFEPDLAQTAAHYSNEQTSQLGGKPATRFSGAVRLYDRHGNIISLYSEVTLSYSAHGHTAAALPDVQRAAARRIVVAT